MKKKRLGEVLRERGHVSTADLNQILLDQRGKRVHLGELLLQNNKVAKIDLISALAEVSDIPYLDCTRVQVNPEALKLIPQAMASGMEFIDISPEAVGKIEREVELCKRSRPRGKNVKLVSTKRSRKTLR